MKLLSFPFAIVAMSTVALSVGCGKVEIDPLDTATQSTDTGTAVVDADNDGVAVEDDCDDTDANLGAVAEDRDCDGWLTADDCDDRDDTIGLCPITHSGGGDMIFIHAGTFDMGCTTAQQATGDCDSDESPVHSVTLTHAFYMGETEVTQGEYQAVMGTNPSDFSSCGTDCPVEYISWHEAAQYANVLSVADGLTECFRCTDDYCITHDSPYTCDGYRLPTEAEWEYAARAGTDYVYAGSNTVGDVGWYDGNSAGSTHPVAEKLPNDWGLYDMSGNVWEWTWDLYDEYYYLSSPSIDPEGPTLNGTDYRVLRGGGYGSSAQNLRVSGRRYDTPAIRYGSIGLRLTRTANP